MKQQEFIKNFAEQFDETDLSAFEMTTNFRDLDEWSSLTALAVLNMLSKKYDVKISIDDFKRINTLEALYDLILSKKQI